MKAVGRATLWAGENEYFGRDVARSLIGQTTKEGAKIIDAFSDDNGHAIFIIIELNIPEDLLK